MSHARSRSVLFEPTAFGDIVLPSRVVMAPMTRSRADHDGVPTPPMATYYAQRATAGLIVSEMTYVAADGRAQAATPGLHEDAQMAAWRRVTRAVHGAGGRLVAQLAHAGRISHPSLQPDGAAPVAPSAIRPSGVAFTKDGERPFVTPRALAPDELPRIVDAFADATRRARSAGFDGVELHAANGYLIDQFLRDGTNRRTDAYGGTVPNRARLLLEVIEAVAGAWASERVGVRLSPFNPYNDIADADPARTFSGVARLIGGRRLAYLHVVEPIAAASTGRLTPTLRREFGGQVIVNGGFGRAEADDALRTEADAVSFGAPFIANPDLPRRLALGLPLRQPDAATFYGGGERGYIDYVPFHAVA